MTRFGFDLDGTIASLDIHTKKFNAEYFLGRSVLMRPQDIVSEGDDIVIISARLKRYRRITEEWLRANDIHYDILMLLGLPAPNIGEDFHYAHAIAKAKAISETGVEVYYEDVPLIVEHLRLLLPNVKIILMEET